MQLVAQSFSLTVDHRADVLSCTLSSNMLQNQTLIAVEDFASAIVVYDVTLQQARISIYQAKLWNGRIFDGNKPTVHVY